MSETERRFQNSVICQCNLVTEVTKRSRNRKQVNVSTDEEGSDNISLHDTDDRMDWAGSDSENSIEGQPCTSQMPLPVHPDLQSGIEPGKYALVNYGGKLYPRKISN